jgi:hypothetical protein
MISIARSDTSWNTRIMPGSHLPQVEPAFRCERESIRERPQGGNVRAKRSNVDGQPVWRIKTAGG